MMHNYIAENTYTSQGTLAAWKHVQQSGSSVVTPVEECRKLGNFDYRKQGMKKFALERADFAYGYFDSEGVHWTLTDAIGSIELVVSGDGRVEQHTGYYPYGQPWRATAGQQRLFGGKELRTFGGLNDYDFHARFQNPAGPFFQSADRHAANTPALSPWTFAAANPVRFTDPTGLDIAVISTGMHVGMLVGNSKNGWKYYSKNGVPVYELTKGWIGGNNHHNLGKQKFDSVYNFLISDFNREGEKEEKESDQTAGYKYTKAYVIETSESEDQKAEEAFTEAVNNGYTVGNGGNCADAVQEALVAAGINVDKNSAPVKAVSNVIKKILPSKTKETLKVLNAVNITLPSTIYNNAKKERKGVELIVRD